MKVLFFNPSRAGQGNIPLNIPLLIGAAKARHHEVWLFDLSDYQVFDDKLFESAFFKEAAFGEERILQARKLFHGKDYGIHVRGYDLKSSDYRNDFESVLNRFAPDMIAVSCLSVDFPFAADFLRSFRNRYRIPVVFGGIHAILMPDEVIHSDVCDILCTGEGENTFPELLDCLDRGDPLEKVRGVWFKKNGCVHKTPPMPLTDFADLPEPDFDLFDPIHFYRPFDGKRYVMLNYELSRGCPFNCTYCVNGVLKEKYRGLGRYHRIKDPRRSIRELETLTGRYGFNFIRFWDEDFTSIPEEFLKEYGDLYLEKIGLPFLIYARVDTVTEEKVRILKRMGCRTFAMGIESGNEFIRRKIMNRNISNETIVERFRLVKSHGIRVSSYNIIGLPFETRESIEDTIELNRRVNPDSFSVTLLEPYKGTPIRKICEDEGLDPGLEPSWNKVQFIPRGMTKTELMGLYRTFPLYIKFPRSRFHEIRRAETDERSFHALRAELKEHEQVVPK